MKNAFKTLSRTVLIAAFGIIMSFLFTTETKAEVTVTSTTYTNATCEYIPYSDGLSLTVMPEEGYYCDISCISVPGCNVSALGSNANPTGRTVYYIEFPNTDGDVYIDITVTARERPLKTVTFIVVNGKWNDNTTDNKSGDVVWYGNLNVIPDVGNLPDEGFEAGSWDTTPNNSTLITEDKTYTYTYAEKSKVTVNVTFKVKNGSWNDGTKTNKTKNLWRYENEDLALQLTAADIPGVGNNPDSGYRAGSWDVEPPIDTNLSNESRNLTYTYTYSGSGSSGSKKSDDSDSHETSSSPEKPSWTPEKAAATIAAQKAQKQQAAATQLASIQTLLRTKTSDRAGTGRNVIDLDMTKVDILDPATVNLLLLNNRFAFNVKISVPGGLTTTIMIPANFNFRPFIKADGTMNIHEVLWWIISKKK